MAVSGVKRITLSCLSIFAFLTNVMTSSFAYAAEGGATIEPDEDDTTELARAAQNPIASMISLPFQNNTDFNFCPKDKTLNTTKIQPALPFSLNDDWNVITRNIISVASQPEINPDQDRETGLGNTTFTAFFSKLNHSEKLLTHF